MIKVAVIMGGYTKESDVSMGSGAFICKHLDPQKYEVYQVCILEDNWYVKGEEMNYPIMKGDFSFLNKGKKTTFDVVYNVIHGTPGEDGHMQAYFELIGMPYSGARAYQSALTFNKRDTLSVLEKFGVNKAKSIYLTRGEPIDYQVVADSLGVPFFVKPNQSGSSLGISKVSDEKDFQKALDLAFKEDPQILIESEIKGDEVSVGVVSVDGDAKAVGITQIISDNEFFDYDAKYNGESNEITPAAIPYETAHNCMHTAENIYHLLNLTGMARLDFIIKDEIPYFLEVNTNPGMSDASIFPQQVAAGNYNFSEMLDNEIQIAFKEKPIWNQE